MNKELHNTTSDTSANGVTMMTLERFAVRPAEGPMTYFEQEEVGLLLRRGAGTTHGGEHDGPVVAVKLNVDGEGYAIVAVDPSSSSLKVIDEAIAHLQTVRDALERLEGRRA